MMTEKEKVLKQISLELARRSFWEYCKLKVSDFYKPNRKYLETLCNTLQDFYYSDDKVLIINLPPRHGKSRTASMFVEWVLGNHKNAKIMTGSYNETLSTSFSKNVRNSIQEQKADDKLIVYNDIFYDRFIKRGDGSMNLWSVEGGYNSYLATAPKGSATGFGCSLMIIDDLIKNAEEARNAIQKAKHWEWFTNTMLSRLEENGKIIIIMTRWASDDLAGRCMQEYKNAKVIKLKALQDNGKMLCDEVLSYESYKQKARLMGEDIASANYQQEPIDLKGQLYTKFKTYEAVPKNNKGQVVFEEIRNYTDSADTGSDYLCSICYGVYKQEAYILDVIYTQKSMEFTEPMVAKMLYNNNVNRADFESNNGGRGFARSVERILQEDYGWNGCYIHKFHQRKNKEARILSNATWVMEHIYYPINWRDKWNDFYKSMLHYQRTGKNEHDDAQDTITGIAEKVGGRSRSLISFE